LVKGKTLAIDATTLEANAALRPIVRRDTDESYQDFLLTLAQASGISKRGRCVPPMFAHARCPRSATQRASSRNRAGAAHAAPSMGVDRASTTRP